MKQFDWNMCKEQRSKATYEFLKKVHNTDISEEEFVRQWTELDRSEKPRQVNRTRSPHAAKHQYRRLKERFGFFTPQSQDKEKE